MVSTMVLSCRQQSLEEETAVLTEETETPIIINETIPEEDLNPGIVKIYVTEELASVLEGMTDEAGKVMTRSVKSVSKGFDMLNVSKMRRLFPYAGEFEERTRAAGLHRWYCVEFDESTPLTRASKSLSLVDGIEKIELDAKIAIVGGDEVLEYVDCEQVSPNVSPVAASGYPFNDPKLKDQWHYFNDGSLKGAVSGCDINVFPVWKSYTTGDPSVIVAVVDGGIDYSHEDLAANMWNNPEKSGDQKYGYNFVSDGYKITPENHGTHVAGTISAVNNNGKGVCGVAGGNAAAGKGGVKLMSCQIFQGNKSGSGEEAIKWGADHGAVISQNSWGYTNGKSTSGALKEAVDYFIKNAGYDKSGKQTGPMGGGIVIFAAGNDDTVAPSTGSYENILAVTSVGADYRRAYYSNYGSTADKWVNIAAPGGDYKKGFMILSTLPGNKYGMMQGTSMACPHVSGVAALIVSYNKGKITSKGLWDRLVNNTSDISAYNPNYYMGSGLVNTKKSLGGKTGKAPNPVTDLQATTRSNNVNFSLTVPSDSDDGKPNVISLYYSQSDFTKTAGRMSASFYVGDLNAGDTMTGVIPGLEFNKTYYIAAVAEDAGGNQSTLSSRVKVLTTDNNPPVIEALGPLVTTIKEYQTYTFKFKCSDEDGHYVSTQLMNPEHHAEFLDTLDQTLPNVIITGLDNPGTFTSTIRASDIYGLFSELKYTYTIEANNPPREKKILEDRIFTSKAPVPVELKTSDYFEDIDGETLKYVITNDNEAVVNVNEAEGILYITPLNYGISNVSVNVADCKSSITRIFKVLVRDGSQPIDIYPNPVEDYLFVRTDKEASADISIYNNMGAAKLSESLKISPFDPAKIDMSGYAPGVYTVKVTYDSNTVSKTIVKL